MQTRETRPRLHTRRPLVNHHNSYLTRNPLSQTNRIKNPEKKDEKEKT